MAFSVVFQSSTFPTESQRMTVTCGSKEALLNIRFRIVDSVSFCCQGAVIMKGQEPRYLYSGRKQLLGLDNTYGSQPNWEFESTSIYSYMWPQDSRRTVYIQDLEAVSGSQGAGYRLLDADM